MPSLPFLQETCALCGEPIGLQSHTKLAQDQYLCGKCRSQCHPKLTDAMLSRMGPDQVKQHISACEELRVLYREQFGRTRAFYAGKKRDLLAFEVDDEHGWWADPSEEQPLVHSLKDIVDYEVRFDNGVSYVNAIDELAKAISTKSDDLNKVAEQMVQEVYAVKSKIDIPKFKAGELPSAIMLDLTMDGDKSLVDTWTLNLPMGRWLRVSPGNIKAAIACATDIILYLKQRRSDAYAAGMEMRFERSNDDNDRISVLAARGFLKPSEADLLHYYLYRMPLSAFEYVQRSEFVRKPLRYQIVKGVVDAVSANLVNGQKAPEWKSQIDSDPQVFYSAVTRYAPGLVMSEVVCICDDTKLMSGRNGILLALDSFAADRFTPAQGEGQKTTMPIAYDDLMYVDRKGDQDLVCVYRDGRSCRLHVGKYTHYLFAALNCIIMLRSYYASLL